MIPRAAIACAFAALLSGCATTQSRSGSDPALTPLPVEPSRSGYRNPALVFATPELQQMLAGRGLPPGFSWEDWEYGRNDQALPLGAPPPRAGFRAFEITQYDQLSDYSGRPRTSSRTTVRSFQTGAAR